MTDIASKLIDGAIAKAERLAAERGQVIYAVFRRNAGWAIQWHDAARVTTKPPPKMKTDWRGSNWPQIQKTNEQRLREGLVIFKYYPTLSACLEGEVERLRAERKEARAASKKRSAK